MRNIDDIANVNDKKQLIQGTGAELSQGVDWFIQVPNGKYDIKITLKLVADKTNKSE